MSISILILTKNEEQDLPDCLQSVAWSDDVHVYDSLSTDGTIDIAKRFGAKITSRAFDNWSSHQNWGLENIKFKYEWVFYIDADERMSPELVAAVCAAAKTPADKVAFRVRRRDFLRSTWLKRVQVSPFYTRLFRPNKMRYERLVNPVSIVDGPIGSVVGFLDHYPFSKGYGHWLARHNSYSSLEASENFSRNEFDFCLRDLKLLFSRDFSVRRAAQKGLFYRLPARPLIKFIILYFLKFGLLDGRAGFEYAVLQSFYEFMIVLKSRELKGSR